MSSYEDTEKSFERHISDRVTISTKRTTLETLHQNLDGHTTADSNVFSGGRKTSMICQDCKKSDRKNCKTSSICIQCTVKSSFHLNLVYVCLNERHHQDQDQDQDHHHVDFAEPIFFGETEHDERIANIFGRGFLNWMTPETRRKIIESLNNQNRWCIKGEENGKAICVRCSFDQVGKSLQLWGPYHEGHMKKLEEPIN